MTTKIVRWPSFLILSLLVSSSVSGQQAVDFESQIRPILSDRCFACHGPDEADREADLRLDERESATRETEYGDLEFVIKPGDPENSELLARLLTDDEDLKMPPPESHLKVSDKEIALIRQWIQEGANWSEHWAFVPVSKPELPVIPNQEWGRSFIDKFVLRKLHASGLKPSAAASKAVLARRLYFDLTGLPPTIEQLDSFLNDESTDAVERLVDQLLASPAYGERMAVDWLDVARYSDTHGYQLDFESFVWPYRDWVVNAFNENLPFDDFVTWQLAGDLLPNATREQILATEFNRLHRQTNEGGSVKEEFRLEYVADRVDTFGVAFLGLSVGCARCHDHKFDPISQQEYYELSAFFDNIDEVGVFAYFTKATPTPALELASADQSEKLSQLKRQVVAAREALDAAIAAQQKDFQGWLETKRGDVDLAALRKAGLIADFDFEKFETEVPKTDAEKTKKGQKKSLPRKIVRNQVDTKSPGYIHESPKIVPGKRQNGLRFNGDNGFTSSATETLTRHDTVSFSFWMKASKKYGRATVLHTTLGATDSGNRGIDLVILDGRLNATICHFWPGNAIRIQAKAELPVDKWAHVVLTYDGSSKASGTRLYLNGVLAETEVIRDGLTRSIRHLEKDKVGFKEGNTPHHTTVGYRYRDRGFTGGSIDALKIYSRELSAFEVAKLAGLESNLLSKPTTEITKSELGDLFLIYRTLKPSETDTLADKLRAAQIEYSALAESVDSIMVMRELATPRTTYFRERGAYDAPGKVVQPNVISKLLKFDDSLPRNRLGLARWLTDSRNPLAARVAVNRIWQMMMGRGLVGTQEDFGSQGSLPSHPELLDYLCHDFMKNGWDVKRLVKQIAMSATYQQASAASPEMRERDPENELLARGASSRLSADQIYEDHGGFGLVRAPAKLSILNYLRKLYQFGWAFGEVMRSRPTICLPDDHDVLQGNLWGEGGADMGLDPATTGGVDITSGYIEPIRMLNAVHRTQTAHHPDPYDPTPSQRGLSVYYGDLVYGNVSFAILADRQWKSGPERVKVTVGVTGQDEDPEMINPGFDKEGLELLGERQKSFLKIWGQDWKNHKLKAVLSQTVFAGISTHQPRPNRYLKYDFDSSGWPASARNRAIDAMRESMALHICGDTHLGTLSQYGVAKQRDSNWAFCTPAISAGWPRWWLPDEVGLKHTNRPTHGLPNTGEFLDSFGNKIFVYAVGNPVVSKAKNRYQKAHEKGSGFGFIVFDTDEKTYTLNAYRFLVNVEGDEAPQQFPGWPVTIHQEENKGINRIK